MRHSFEAISAHYLLVGPTLYKRLASGSRRPVRSVVHGRLVTTLQGELLYGSEIAWALINGMKPMFPVINVDEDPFNMSDDNLACCRIKRLRFRLRSAPDGYSHALNPSARFDSEGLCFADWVGFAKRWYAADLANVLRLTMYTHEVTPAVEYVRPKKAATYAGAKKGVRPPAPQYVAGMKHYWFKGQWVQVPEACHCSDDWQVRCDKWLRGARTFAFNPETQVVDGFDAAGALVA